MEKQEIPADVRSFVLSNIPSIPHMEALMLLRQAAPECWSASALARRLYVSEQSAAAVLADLSCTGLLRCDAAAGTFCYSHSPDGPAMVVDKLSALYASHLVEVTGLIHSKRDLESR